MTENPYITLTFDELKAVYTDIQKSEKNGRRADSLLLIYKCRVSVPNSQLGLNPLIV